MYCSISDAWNQENTMANLAKRFNNEYFSNNSDMNGDYFRINSNQHFIENFSGISSDELKEPVKKEEPKIEIKKEIVKVPNVVKKVQKVETKYKEYTCEELINKVLSCEKCRSMLFKKINLFNPSLYNNLLIGTNKEIIILVLIGLIIIIILDLFLKITNSLN